MIKPFVVLRQPLTSANADQNGDCNQVSEIDREIADFTKAIALSPEDAWAIFFRGMAYEAKGDLDRAIADYDKLVALKPNNANMYVIRGLAYADWREDDRAIANFRKALDIDPTSKSAKEGLERLGAMSSARFGRGNDGPHPRMSALPNRSGLGCEPGRSWTRSRNGHVRLSLTVVSNNTIQRN